MWENSGGSAEKGENPLAISASRTLQRGGSGHRSSVAQLGTRSCWQVCGDMGLGVGVRVLPGGCNQCFPTLRGQDRR